MKILLFAGTAGLLIIAILSFLLVSKNNKGHDTVDTPTPTLTQTLSQEDQCRKNILSDNNLYEDRMAKAVKTCVNTQICTYEDFKMWSAANGNYVPDWRSEDYMTLEIQKCIQNWPTPTIASPSGIPQ